MDLRNYLKKNNIKRRDFAFLIDTYETTLKSYIYKKTTPSVLTALKILSASKFEVNINTLLSYSDEDNFLLWEKRRSSLNNKELKNLIEKWEKEDEKEDFIEESEEILDNYISPNVPSFEKSFVSKEKYEELLKIVESYRQADRNAEEEMKKFT
jgi:transcriptional regulator with XRE-family HTH domain